MAGDKDTTNYIIRGVPSTIQPVCSSGLTFIWDSSNNYWYYNHESTTTFPLTISATGYVSQTITTSTSSGGYYWIDVTLKPENLYAWIDSSVTGEQLYGWTNGTTTVYTKSATPSSGDDYYDANGNAYGQYELTVNGFSLLIGINTYDSTNNLIKIKGDAV